MIDDIGRLLELGLNTLKSHPWRPYWRAEMENVTVFTRDRFFRPKPNPKVHKLSQN